MSSVARSSARASGVETNGIDLMHVRPISRLVRWGGFPYLPQLVFLAVFVAIAVFGWGLYSPEGVPDKLYAKTNLVNLLIWGLWWPAMVWTAVLFGRLWCAVCPLELVSNVTERLGARLGVRQRNLAKWLRAGWLMCVFYVLIQLLVAGIHLHRVPMYTSLFMLGLLAAAAVVGFFVRDRAFCRGFCPVGLLLSTYGRGGMLAVRAGSAGICASCEGKDCIRSCNRQRLDARSCPSLLNPPKLNSNKDCLVCGQCIKACQPGNMQLLLRRPFSSSGARETLAPWPVTLFVMAVSGFVTYEISGAWEWAESMFRWLPNHIGERVGLGSANGWTLGLWNLIVFPCLLWTVLGGLLVALGRAANVRDAWQRFALPMAVLVSSAHMAKGLEKLTTWGCFLPGALRDPTGVDTALRYHSGAEALPPSLLSGAGLGTIAIGLVFAGVYLAIREARLAAPESWRRHHGAPFLLAGAAVAVCVAGWALA